MISELQEKLEKKDFEIAKQYYTIRDYKASIKSNENFIASFPELNLEKSLIQSSYLYIKLY